MNYPLGLVFLCLVTISIHAEGEFEINAGLLLGHDSNVAVDEIDLVTTNGDRFLTGRFGVAYENAIDDNQSFKLSYNLSDKHYGDNEQFNLQNHLASVGYNIKHDKVTYGLTYRYVHSNLDSKRFLTISQVTPSLSWFISKKHYLRFAYTFHDKTLEDNTGRNANSHELSSDYYYFANGLNSYFIVAVKARDEDADDELFNYSSQQLRIAYQKRFNISDHPLKASIDLRVREREYTTQIHPSIGDFRLDETYSSSFSLEWEVGEHWLWQWNMEYADRQSNLASVDFSQTLISAGFEYRY